MDKISIFLTKRLRDSNIIAVFCLAAAVTGLFLPAIMGWKGIFHDDLARESFSKYYFIAANLRHGIIPLWDPYTWCGAIPFYAQYLSDTYYICLWPFLFFADMSNPDLFYWSVILIPLWLHGILAAGGMFVFLRRLIRCSPFSSYFGAIAYVFSPCFTYANVWPQAVFSLAWIPWLLILYASAIKQWRFWKIITGGLIFSLILTSGQITYWHFTVFLWGAAAIFFIISQIHEKKDRPFKSPLVVFFLIFIIGVGLSSVYLFSFLDGRQYTQEHIGITLDAALNNSQMNVPVFYLATLFIPNLFANITGINMLDIMPDEICFWEANFSAGMAVSLLVLLALIFALKFTGSTTDERSKRRWALAFSGIYLLGILCAMGRHTPFYRYVIGSIPVIKTFPFPARYRMLQCFAVCVLAPIALDYLTDFSFARKARQCLRHWIWTYVIASFLIIAAAFGYSFGYCRYKIFDRWSEPAIITADKYLSAQEGIGRYTSVYFVTKKIRIMVDGESSGEVRYADNEKVTSREGVLAAYYYASKKGPCEFDVRIPPGKFVWINQKAGKAKIGYEERAESRDTFYYDKSNGVWACRPGINALWFYYREITKNGRMALGQNQSLKEEFLRVFREEDTFRRQVFIGFLYWLIISAVMIAGLYYLRPKRFGYLLGVVALIELLFFGVYVFYWGGYGWHPDSDVPKRSVKPSSHPIVQQLISPPDSLIPGISLRIASTVAAFEDNLRIDKRSCLTGFGMHPIETRFKRAFELAYGRPLDWDYYDSPRKFLHTPFLNHFSVGYFLSDNSEGIFPGNNYALLPGPSGLFVHINPDALPRVFTLDRVVAASEKEQLNRLVSGDLRQAVYSSTPGLFPVLGHGPDEEKDFASHFTNLQQNNPVLKLDLDNPNRIDVDIEVKKSAMLVFTETWYPGWEAAVDGRPVSIYRVNYCQRGIWLDKGIHSVRLRFRPLAWRWGAGISLGTIILLVFLIILLKSRRITR